MSPASGVDRNVPSGTVCMPMRKTPQRFRCIGRGSNQCTGFWRRRRSCVHTYLVDNCTRIHRRLRTQPAVLSGRQAIHSVRKVVSHHPDGHSMHTSDVLAICTEDTLPAGKLHNLRHRETLCIGLFGHAEHRSELSYSYPDGQAVHAEAICVSENMPDAHSTQSLARCPASRKVPAGHF